MTQTPDAATIANRAPLKVGRDHWPLLRATIIAVVITVVYLTSLWISFTEADRRALTLEIPPVSGNYLHMDVNIVHVDLLRSEMTARVIFHLIGRLGQDELTPSTDLQLVLNTVNGQQQFDFPKGQRINPIEVEFPLEGEVNFYPFDHHKGVMWFFVTMPGKPQAATKQSSSPTTNVVPEELSRSPGLPVSASVLGQKVQVDTRTTFSASVSGLTFRGSRSVQSVQTLKGLTGIEVNLKRSQNVMLISVTAMLMMAALSIGLVTMVLKIVGRSRNMGTFHIPMAVSLIFGLPALRNIQPGVPPPGTFGDSIVFTWAEMAAAASAVALIANWLIHRRRVEPPSAT